MTSPHTPDRSTTVRASKFLSLVLRHSPETIGLRLDEHGWASVDDLLAVSAAAGRDISPDLLRHVVETNDKKRFTLSEDGQRIRAAQGHSVTVALALPPSAPPPVLFHGTATRFVDSILSGGLRPGNRQQVHLSAEETTAQAVGARHGRPVVFAVDTVAMTAAGHEFFQADNGVWLTDSVPATFLVLRG